MVLANIYRHDSDAIYRYIFGHNCSNPIQSNWIKMKWNEGKLESSQRLESLDDSVEKLDTAGDGIHISAVLNIATIYLAKMDFHKECSKYFLSVFKEWQKNIRQHRTPVSIRRKWHCIGALKIIVKTLSQFRCMKQKLLTGILDISKCTWMYNWTSQKEPKWIVWQTKPSQAH